MNGEHIISSLEEVYVLSRVSRKSSSGEYLGVGLPDAVRQVGWQKGDHIDLTLESRASNGHQFQYLKGVKTEADRGQKIQHGTANNPTLKLGIPIRWTDTDNDTPDFDIDSSSKVIIQLRAPDEIALIRASDFFKIHKGQEGAYPVSSGERETIDLATEHGYDGQRFRIRPFNTFSVETSSDDPADGIDDRPFAILGTPQLFERLKQEHQVPVYAPRHARLDVFWDEEATEATDLEQWRADPGTLDEKELYSISTDPRPDAVRKRDRSTNPPFHDIEFVLPEQGAYYFLFSAQEGETFLSQANGDTWAAYVGDRSALDHQFNQKGQMIDNRWVGMYFAKRDDVIEIFVPVQNQVPTQEEFINWMWDNTTYEGIRSQW